MADYKAAQDVPKESTVTFPDKNSKMDVSTKGKSGSGEHRFAGYKGRGETGRTLTHNGTGYGKKRGIK